MSKYFTNKFNWYKLFNKLSIAGALLLAVSSCKKNVREPENIVVRPIVSYKVDIKPILVNNCYSCHSLSASDPAKPGYAYLDIFDQLKYYALSPSTRNPSYTTLQARLRFIETPGMPYKKTPLDDSLIKKIDDWVKAGAPDN